MATDPNIVANNIKALIGKGAPEADVDAYVKSEGYNTPEEFKAASQPWLKKAGINLLQTGRSFVDPIQAFKSGEMIGKEVIPQIPGALKQAIPYKSVISGKYDFSGLKKLREQLPQEMGHPIEAIKQGKVASTAATWMPLKGLMRTPKTPKMTPVSELIAGKLERSTVENVAQNPYVQKGMTILAKEDLNDVVNNAAKSTMEAREKISNAQNYIYQKAGITDDFIMPQNNVKEALTNIRQELDSFKKIAIGENKKIAGAAEGLYDDLINLNKTEPLNFGQIKSVTRQVYDLADTNVTENGRLTEAGRLYNKIGAELTKAKKSTLPIKEAGEKYSQLMEAESTLRETLRLDRVNGEQTLPLKIMRRYKDAEHGQFKEQLEKVNDIFKKNADIFNENPETKGIINEYGNADFVDQIKLTQALQDVTSKRAVTPQGIGRMPGIAYLSRALKLNDPMAKMVALKKGVKSGLIDAKSVSKQIPVSESILGGMTINKIRGLRELLGIPKYPINPLTPVMATEKPKKKK